jgi:hypothetical protein
MSTLNQLIYNIKDSAGKGKSTRANAYGNRQIQFWIQLVRNFLITKDVEKTGQVHVAFEQDLGCVALTNVDQADCPETLWGKRVKKVVIPEVVEIKGNAGLAFFGLVDKRTRIYLPDTQYGELDDFVPYRKKRQDYLAYQIGNTIYITGEDPLITKLCHVNIRGIFKDPTLVTTCGSANQEPECFDPANTCYPIPADLEQTLIDMVMEKYVLRFANAKEDGVNNERPDGLV